MASASQWLLGGFCAATIAAIILAVQLKTGLFWGAVSFLGWGMIVSLIHFLYFRFELVELRDMGASQTPVKNVWSEVSRDQKPTDATDEGPRIERQSLFHWFQRRGEIICLVVGVLLLIGPIQAALLTRTLLSVDSASLLRLGSILFLGISFALYFLGRYGSQIELHQGTPKLNAPLHLARLGFWICLIIAACLFAFLYMGHDFGLWLGPVIGLLTSLLVVDAGVRAGMAAFQPRSAGQEVPPLGGGLVLDAFFRRGSPWDALVHHVETSFGVKVGESWVSEFLRGTIEPIILLGIILVWLSTCFTAVPTQSRGVRVRWGRYLAPALEPGLYVTWPWPAEMIEIVPTERVGQIALGFEHDLGGPALWTETHYEGEQNLLVGNGEEMLSISVPIYYRIKDALAYLKTTTDAQQALTSLAYRQLLAVTEARDSFRVMTVERQAISQALKQSLQQEVDHMHLGLEIVFVGLKDIHPPVAVAPAFQDVISAEEEKVADLHNADTYHFQTMAQAGQQANRLRTEADAMFKQRTALAEGESARFLILATADAANTNLFRLRLRLETLERALDKPQKVVLTGGAATNGQFYLDLRGLGGLPLP
ncbi:MAG TPA: SPFH domain-containing protein [Verrucomicrobiae bacterium]|nr:SPFH domain-containing protein [Verrucomicrobiae bacterium]